MTLKREKKHIKCLGRRFSINENRSECSFCSFFFYVQIESIMREIFSSFFRNRVGSNRPNVINSRIDTEQCLSFLRFEPNILGCDSILAINVIRIWVQLRIVRVHCTCSVNSTETKMSLEKRPFRKKWHEKCTKHASSCSIRWIHINQVWVCNVLCCTFFLNFLAAVVVVVVNPRQRMSCCLFDQIQ